MSKSSLVLLALVGLASSLNMDAEWETYKMEYGKSYDNREEPTRKAMFLKKYRQVQEHNALNASWTMEVNFFADMTEKEMRSFSKARASKINYASSRDFEVSSNRQTLPKEIDLRSDRCMPPVKNQGACGCCYAFSAMTPIEYQACKKNGGKLTTFSEQQIVDCSVGTGGCHGGWMVDVWDHQKNFGIFTESEYSYRELAEKSSRKVCPYCKRKPSANSVRPKVWGEIKESAGVSASDAMVQAINKYGPISVALEVSAPIDKSLMNYKEGIYDEPRCVKRPAHAVVIVGYGKDAKTGLDYWIVRNSWGNKWAPKMAGHFLIRRGVNRCGIESYAFYASLD